MNSEDRPLVEHDPSQSDMMQEMCLVVDSKAIMVKEPGIEHSAYFFSMNQIGC